MKIKLSKNTLQSIKALLFLLVMLILALQVKYHVMQKGQTAIQNFLHSLGVNQ